MGGVSSEEMPPFVFFKNTRCIIKRMDKNNMGNVINKSYIVNINSNFRDENGERTIRIFTNDGRYHDIVIPSVSGSSSSRKNSSSQVSIASNGNWEIDGKDTGQSSKGQDGKDGTSGCY